MKAVITIVLLLYSGCLSAGVIFYRNDVSVIALEESSDKEFISVTLYGGSNDSGASSPADCIVKFKLTQNKSNYSGVLIPFSTELMGYDGAYVSTITFKFDRVHAILLTSSFLDVCPLGTDFNGEYAIVSKASDDYKSMFDEFIGYNHTNALTIYHSGEIKRAIKLLEPYVSEAKGKGYYYSEAFNDYGYFLQQAGFYDEAIYILNDVIKSSPERVVAYLNLADAYWGKHDNKRAVYYYGRYIKMMKENDSYSKIPKRVIERFNDWYTFS